MNDLLPGDSKTLRHLTGSYLARPDPTAWLVAADLLEENGRDAEAARWRRRAEWFDLVRAEVDLCLDEWPVGARYTGPSRQVRLAPFLVKMRRRGLCLRVLVRQTGLPGGPFVPVTGESLPKGHPWEYGNSWRLNVAHPARYFNEKVVGLIDDLHDNPL